MILARNSACDSWPSIAGKPEDRHSPPEIKREWQRMLVKATAPKNTLIAEGTYPAMLKSITPLPDDKNPKKVGFGFKTDDNEVIVTKELPLSFDDGKPLRKDAETLIGRSFTTQDARDGFDLDKLIGERCRVVVMHRSGSGGKPQAAVSLILAEN